MGHQALKCYIKGLSERFETLHLAAGGAGLEPAVLLAARPGPDFYVPTRSVDYDWTERVMSAWALVPTASRKISHVS